LWAEQDRVAGGEFRPEFVDLVTGGSRGFLLVSIPPSGRSEEWMRVVVYEIEDGVIAGATEDDPVAVGRFSSMEQDQV
jgi:hypothetical protein